MRFSVLDLDMVARAADAVIPGDIVIGAEDEMHLIRRTLALNAHELNLLSVSEDGVTHHAIVAKNAMLKTCRNYDRSLLETTFSMSWCQNCDSLRARPGEWAEDDYICKVCRSLLESL